MIRVYATTHHELFLGMPRDFDDFREPSQPPRLSTPGRLELGNEYAPDNGEHMGRRLGPEVVIEFSDAHAVVRWFRSIADEIEDHVAGLPAHRIEVNGQPVVVHP
jgi:hypothetical protein